MSLPNAAEEQCHPGRSDQRYVYATRELIAYARRREDQHPLVKVELINYGFGRNLLALKPVAITLLITLLVVDAGAISISRDPAAATTLAIHTLLLVGWIKIVCPNWVLRQGNNYAERLFETLLAPPNATTSTS